MGNSEEIPGTSNELFHTLEAKALMGAAMDAYEAGEIDKFERLKELAAQANEKAIIDTHKDLTGEE
jgi:hypothetical protein